MSNAPQPSELEDLAVALARGAAQVVTAGRAAGLDVSAKSTSTDLVTSVDRATERWLRERIAQLRPDDGVLGEEAGGQRGTSGVRWIVDPIDGTVNFVLGLPQYAVSVAAEVDGVVVAGAVCNPAIGETFRAHLGGGAFLEPMPGAEGAGGRRRRLSGPRDVPLERAVVGTGFGYDAARRRRQAAAVEALIPRIADIRRLGAASLDLCFVAAGRLDAYFEVGLNPWDYAAGALVATEAGCVTSGLHGRPAGPDIYATAAPALAPSFFALLEEVGADVLNN